MNSFAVFDVVASVNVDDIAELDAQVVSRHCFAVHLGISHDMARRTSVHLNFAFVHVVGRQDDEDYVGCEA